MKHRKILQISSYLLVVGLLTGFNFTSRVFAQQSSSPNYQIDEVFVGAGGGNDASSASFQARASIGDLGVGNSSSTNYQAYGGFTTTGAPYLEVNVTSTDLDLGTLDPSTTTTGSTTFNVRAYLTSGYNVMIRGSAPTSEGGATITPLATQSSPTTGTEQFGLNLVANTSPTTFGADPVQIPDASFSFGVAESGYNTANQYKYVSGETFASSPRSSGQTNYTISYIFNVSNITDAGRYEFDQNLIVVATY
jgi:hypothetical protein